MKKMFVKKMFVKTGVAMMLGFGAMMLVAPAAQATDECPLVCGENCEPCGQNEYQACLDVSEPEKGKSGCFDCDKNCTFHYVTYDTVKKMCACGSTQAQANVNLLRHAAYPDLGLGQNCTDTTVTHTGSVCPTPPAPTN